MSQIATIKFGCKPLNVHLIFQRSKTHQKDETSNKRRTTKLRHKITRGKDASRKKLLAGVHKTSVKKVCISLKKRNVSLKISFTFLSLMDINVIVESTMGILF